jgi:hypothetical protein
MKLGETPRSTVIPENVNISELFKEFPALFEPEISLLCSPYTATAPYPEPVESAYPIIIIIIIICGVGLSP